MTNKVRAPGLRLTPKQRRAIEVLKSHGGTYLLDEAPAVSHPDLIGNLLPGVRTYFSLHRIGHVTISYDRRGRNPVVKLINTDGSMAKSNI